MRQPDAVPVWGTQNRTEQNRTDAITIIDVKGARVVPDVFELSWMQGIWKIVTCGCVAAAIHKAKEMH